MPIVIVEIQKKVNEVKSAKIVYQKEKEEAYEIIK